MSDGIRRLLTLRLPGWLLLVLWIYVGIKAVFFTGWLWDAAKAALGYVREVSFAAPSEGGGS